MSNLFIPIRRLSSYIPTCMLYFLDIWEGSQKHKDIRGLLIKTGKRFAFHLVTFNPISKYLSPVYESLK